MIEIGQKVKFRPACNGFNTGTVKYVNAKHRWFSIEYGDPKMVLSFNFNDIGKDVKVCKG
jgi:hypothetical protein